MRKGLKVERGDAMCDGRGEKWDSPRCLFEAARTRYFLFETIGKRLRCRRRETQVSGTERIEWEKKKKKEKKKDVVEKRLGTEGLFIKVGRCRSTWANGASRRERGRKKVRNTLKKFWRETRERKVKRNPGKSPFSRSWQRSTIHFPFFISQKTFSCCYFSRHYVITSYLERERETSASKR